MIVFVKKKDPSNKFDYIDVTMELRNDVNMDDIVDAFKQFLVAAGFSPKTADQIEIVDKK